VGVFLEEVMLDLPGMVVPKAVGQFDLLQRVLVELEFVVLFPGAR
jgi:hypothetical protein